MTAKRGRPPVPFEIGDTPGGRYWLARIFRDRAAAVARPAGRPRGIRVSDEMILVSHLLLRADVAQEDDPTLSRRDALRTAIKTALTRRSQTILEHRVRAILKNVERYDRATRRHR